jgi:hypothetical protein
MYIEGMFGNLGKGKTSYGLHRIEQLKKFHPWMPVCSTVPLALPGEGSVFLARSPGDYIAFALTVSRFVWSKDARQISRTLKARRAARKAGKTVLTEDDIKAIYAQLQEEYKTVARSIDPSDKSSLDRWIAAHNYRVLHNKVDAQLGDMEAEAEAMRNMDFYGMARHVTDVHRFKHNPPSMPFYMFLDETGVSAGSEQNAELRKSAFYDFLAQLRKFGGRIAYATHEPMLAWKQLRDITDLFMRLQSWDFPKGRFYVVTGHATAANYIAKKQVRYLDVAWISYEKMGRYPTAWIVTPPPVMSE